MTVYTIEGMEELIRAALDEPSQARITSADILQTLNDGYKDVAIKTCCIERTIYVTAREGERVIPFNGIRINYARVGSVIIFLLARVSLTVPAVPTIILGAAVIAETPLASSGGLTMPGVPTVTVSTMVA